jgi:hypothetical protein
MDRSVVYLSRLFCDLISICVVLVLFVLTASGSLFVYMLTWMIKLILGFVDFLTRCNSTVVMYACMNQMEKNCHTMFVIIINLFVTFTRGR